MASHHISQAMIAAPRITASKLVEILTLTSGMDGGLPHAMNWRLYPVIEPVSSAVAKH
jgi:hypothetical protein